MKILQAKLKELISAWRARAHSLENMDPEMWNDGFNTGLREAAVNLEDLLVRFNKEFNEKRLQNQGKHPE